MLGKLGTERLRLTLFLFALSATNCARPVAPLTELPAGAKLLEAPVDTLIHEFYSGVSKRERLVIRDASVWTAFWNQVYSGVSPKPSVPDLNPGEMVVAATMGSRGSGGYAINIDAIYDTNDQLFVVVREVSPGSTCMVTAVITAPVIAVRLPQRTMVSFVERTATRDCGA
jgi:hypothetical protein